MGLESLRVYRNLLKAVKKHIGTQGTKKHFTDYITQEFRNTSSLTDPKLIKHKINLASNYTYMLNSIHHHQNLLFSYNIAVDRSEEMTRTLRKSAGSVGLQLPEVYRA
ncbi:hypothetical protein C5167_038940 [Papaver somniferum]|uniref:Complex 1 LYR protein domain-containing protein n=1 Tax=Papaver somniferum TaxID=3469 RepID=A0A4Y7ID84_PAPSO|nr:uncharacterized protein LOC113332882 [Papaver somniferum]RZC45986.1 hypothetical protein C5167_038940 [Papaver somniferum]